MNVKLFKPINLFFFGILIIFLGCGEGRLKYKSFEGNSFTLNSLNSKEVLMLYPHGFYNRDSLNLMLDIYDKAYFIAVEIVSQIPLHSSIQSTDKLPLAIIPKSCGPGCGRLGQKGIEIEKHSFDLIYNEFVLNRNQDHLFFYELGRNFWFFGEKSNNIEWEAIHTGFAVFFRDMLINELKVSVAPINQIPYLEYLEQKQILWNKFKMECHDNGFHTWEEIQQTKIRYYRNSPIFWSSIWWDIYKNKGRQGATFTFKELNRRKITNTSKAWFELLSE